MILRRPTELPAAPAPHPTGPSARTAPVLAASPSPTEIGPVLLLAAVVLVPITWGTVVWSAPAGDDDFNRRVTVQLFDLALVLAACPTVAALVSHLRGAGARLHRAASHLSLMGSMVLLLTVLGAFAFVRHPSPRGAELGARLVLGALAAHTIVAAPANWFARLRVATAAMASAQALLAIAQSANAGPLGLRWLEFDGPLYPFGSSFAGRGGLTHPYHLAFVLELGIVAALISLRRTVRPIPWLAAIASCAAGLGVTYSRAAAVGVAATAIALLVPRRSGRREAERRLRLAAFALIAGAAATGLTMGDGWYARTTGSTSVTSADSGRIERAREALELIGDHPVDGVGPGRYAIALAERGDAAPLPAHNFVLHVAAEAGVLAGIAIAIVALLLAHRYLWASRETAAAFVLVVPYFVFDAYPYVFPVGLFVTAVWLGLLERTRAR